MTEGKGRIIPKNEPEQPINNADMTMVKIEGRGRIIRKDGTVVPFEINGEGVKDNGSDTGESDPQRNR